MSKKSAPGGRKNPTVPDCPLGTPGSASQEHLSGHSLVLVSENFSPLILAAAVRGYGRTLRRARSTFENIEGAYKDRTIPKTRLSGA